MNTKRILVGLLLVVSAALLAAFQPFNGEAETAVFNAPAASVAAQTGVGQVTTEGQIVPRFFSDLSFQTGGVVADILVAEGDHVQTGDPLIQLDAGDLEIVLQQAQARLVSAEAGLVAAQNQLALAQAGRGTRLSAHAKHTGTPHAMKIFRFRGGIHPEGNKDPTACHPIARLPLPKRLYIPLQQHIGEPAAPEVKVGDHVLKGQRLARHQGSVSAPVHAPTSGTVIAIGDHMAPHPSGLPVQTITLEPDGEERWVETEPAVDPDRSQAISSIECSTRFNSSCEVRLFPDCTNASSWDLVSRLSDSVIISFMPDSLLLENSCYVSVA